MTCDTFVVKITNKWPLINISRALLWCCLLSWSLCKSLNSVGQLHFKEVITTAANRNSENVSVFREPCCMGDSTDLDISSSQDDRSTLDRDYDPSSQSSSEVTDDQPSVRRVPRSRIMKVCIWLQAQLTRGKGMLWRKEMVLAEVVIPGKPHFMFQYLRNGK